MGPRRCVGRSATDQVGLRGRTPKASRPGRRGRGPHPAKVIMFILIANKLIVVLTNNNNNDNNLNTHNKHTTTTTTTTKNIILIIMMTILVLTMIICRAHAQGVAPGHRGQEMVISVM